VLILEHYFASKSFATAREVFRDAYSDKENTTPTGNKISGRRECLSVTNVHRETKEMKLRLYRFQVVH
jgi:hypothetical protein